MAPPATAMDCAGANAGADDAAGAAAALAAGPSPVASDRITEPWLTLSPILMPMAVTTPESGAGTSIVALSDSSETIGSSAFTVSPTFTKISMTGTSLKSPMSGTRTSATPTGALVADGAALTLGLTASAGAGAAAAPPSALNVMMTLPWLTLSPRFTAMDSITPPRGAGTSIVALSDSSETSGSS